MKRPSQRLMSTASPPCGHGRLGRFRARCLSVWDPLRYCSCTCRWQPFSAKVRTIRSGGGDRQHGGWVDGEHLAVFADQQECGVEQQELARVETMPKAVCARIPSSRWGAGIGRAGDPSAASRAARRPVHSCSEQGTRRSERQEHGVSRRVSRLDVGRFAAMWRCVGVAVSSGRFTGRCRAEQGCLRRCGRR